jgi:hypothetical protein
MMLRAVIFAVLLVALAIIVFTWDSRRHLAISLTALLALTIAIGVLVWESRLPPNCFCFLTTALCCGR